MLGEAPSYKEVLSKVNSVLEVSGLNDRVWNIRDCNSGLFVRRAPVAKRTAAPAHAHAHEVQASAWRCVAMCACILLRCEPWIRPDD